MRRDDRQKALDFAYEVTSYLKKLPKHTHQDTRTEIEAVKDFVVHGIWTRAEFPQDMKQHFEHLKAQAT